MLSHSPHVCALLQEAAQRDRLQSEAARFEAEAAAGAAQLRAQAAEAAASAVRCS